MGSIADEEPAAAESSVSPAETLGFGVPGDLDQALTGDTRRTRDPLIGEIAGNFRLVSRLGLGGMASVYLGEHTTIGSKVAVKVLHEHLASDPELMERFYTEARAVNLVRHQNIVAIHDLGTLASGRPYLIMEYLEGGTLVSFVGKPVELPVLLPILRQICDGLEAAHAHLVHRDLKPDNIFLVHQGDRVPTVKIADFGIAKVRASGARTQVGMVMGTPEYMAPEQFSGVEVDRRADLYSLGVLAYQLATGRLPFQAPGIMELCVAHSQTLPPPPRIVRPELPEALERIILKALAKRPEDRFQTAGELRSALADVPLAESPPSPAVGAAAAPAAVQPTPRPVPARTSFLIKFSGEGAPARSSRAVDLSRGGLFVCEERPPPLFSRVRLLIAHGAGELACEGEVVRHVRPDEASSWGMEPGFAVQFVNVSSELLRSIERLARGQALDQPTPPPRDDVDDPEATRLLARYGGATRDPYVLLGLLPEVECSEVRSRIRVVTQELDALRNRPLSRAQRERLEGLRSRLSAAVESIATPARRAVHDAERGNYRGVANCLAAGLTASELESLRRGFLAQRPKVEASSLVHRLRADSLVAAGHIEGGLAEYEQALSLDPLDLELHRRYWPLRRKHPAKAAPAGGGR